MTTDHCECPRCKKMHSSPYDDAPSEFIDIITQSLIKTPIMLPDAKDIFWDKQPMIKWLRTNPTHPLTRADLAVDYLLKYNEQDDIIAQVNAFSLRLEQFLSERNNRPVVI